MVMEVIKETTVWEDVKRQPNHIYLMEGSKAIAYMPWGTEPAFYFKNGITLDKRGRKFETLKTNPFKVKAAAPEANTVVVEGSKGAKYTVNLEEKTCTCPGYTFRGTCKHVRDL